MEAIRWGILGCGDIAQKRVAEAIQLDARSKLVAACRRDATQPQAFCRRFEVQHATTESTDLIRSDDIDESVATPLEIPVLLRSTP